MNLGIPLLQTARQGRTPTDGAPRMQSESRPSGGKSGPMTDEWIGRERAISKQQIAPNFGVGDGRGEDGESRRSGHAEL